MKIPQKKHFKGKVMNIREFKTLGFWTAFYKITDVLQPNLHGINGFV